MFIAHNLENEAHHKHLLLSCCAMFVLEPSPATYFDLLRSIYIGIVKDNTKGFRYPDVLEWAVNEVTSKPCHEIRDPNDRKWFRTDIISFLHQLNFGLP